MEKSTIVAIILLVVGFFIAMGGMFSFNMPIMGLGSIICVIGFIIWVIGALKGKGNVYT
jgi:hypothetical protein